MLAKDELVVTMLCMANLHKAFMIFESLVMGKSYEC